MLSSKTVIMRSSVPCKYIAIPRGFKKPDCGRFQTLRATKIARCLEEHHQSTHKFCRRRQRYRAAWTAAAASEPRCDHLTPRTMQRRANSDFGRNLHSSIQPAARRGGRLAYDTQLCCHIGQSHTSIASTLSQQQRSIQPKQRIVCAADRIVSHCRCSTLQLRAFDQFDAHVRTTLYRIPDIILGERVSS